jgi:site-specific recombinase XerD
MTSHNVQQNVLLFPVLFPYFSLAERGFNAEVPRSPLTKEDEMANKIDTVTARNKLKIRREPYWQRISKGFFIGFRKMSDSSSGTWLLRNCGENGHEIERSLGTLDDYPQHGRFDKAVDSAREWLANATRPPQEVVEVSQKVPTVMDACDAYLKAIRDLKGIKSRAALDLEARYRRLVRSDPIHEVELSKLTREHCNDFRRRLVETPVRVNKAGDLRERSKDTVNRDIAALRAALNLALEERLVTSDYAWRKPFKSFKNVSKRRTLYLDREQRRKFIQYATVDVAEFLRGLSMLPLRPGALAALIVESFEPRLDVLRIGKDKSGNDRYIKLPNETARLLECAGKNKPPTAPLFARADGLAWNKDSWKKPIKEAAKSAGLPLRTTAYTLRHSVISDLVHGGLDLLTVAQLSGTSVAMIEKHYGHLRSNVAANALANLAL